MTDRPDSDRIQAALAGLLPLSELTAGEADAVHAELNARITRAVASSDWVDDVAPGPVPTVALDDSGVLIEHHPDGSTTPLDRDA